MPVLVVLDGRQPAPMLARRALWVGLHVRPNAFGNALGESLAASAAPKTQGVGPWSDKNYVNEMDKQDDAYLPGYNYNHRNGSDVESDNFKPAMAYGYRNGSDVQSDAYLPAFNYNYRNGSDVQSDAAPAIARRSAAARERQSIEQSDAMLARKAAATAPAGFAGRSTITDPAAYVDPQVRRSQLIDLSSEDDSRRLTSAQWKARAAEWKDMTRQPGVLWSSDSVYNGLFMKGSQAAILERRGLGEEDFNQFGRIGIETNSHADVGVALGAKASVAGLLGVVRLGGSSSLAANDVRFSQNTVSFNKVDRDTGVAYNYDDLVKSMQTNGWRGDPVDAVRMPDGRLTSMDNTRIRAAREAGIGVQANVRDFDARLTADEVGRFTKAGQVPTTWGEALTIRINSQSGSFSRNNPYGADALPRITGRPK